MEPTALLLFCNLMLAGIAAGGQVLVLAAIVPIRPLLPAGAAVVLHREMSRRIDRFMPATVGLAAFTGVLLLLPVGQGDTPNSTLLVFGIAANLCTAVLSIFTLMPINRRVAGWSTDCVPAEFPLTFARWGRLHAARTISSVVAFAAYLLAALT